MNAYEMTAKGMTAIEILTQSLIDKRSRLTISSIGQTAESDPTTHYFSLSIYDKNECDWNSHCGFGGCRKDKDGSMLYSLDDAPDQVSFDLIAAILEREEERDFFHKDVERLADIVVEEEEPAEDEYGHYID